VEFFVWAGFVLLWFVGRWPAWWLLRHKVSS